MSLTEHIAASQNKAGAAWQTQILTAVAFLKEHRTLIGLQDLAIRSGVERLLVDEELLAALKKHDRVEFNQRNSLFRYKPDFELHSKTDLVSLLRRYDARGGLTVKVLKESWPGVVTAIEELEREGEVLTTRSGGTNERDGHLKAVFLNPIRPDARVDSEFKSLWATLRTPDAEELTEELRSAGLSAASETPTVTPVVKGKNVKSRKGRIGSSNRRHRITNTHLKDPAIDLSKDYVPQK